MESKTHGSSTSVVEVTNISRHGFWVLLDESELFLPFQDFPWFRDAPVGEILKVERLGPKHLYWPDLDIDIHVDSIEHPDQFPLVSKNKSQE